MTSDIARPFRSQLRIPVRLAAILISALLPLSSQAQDTNVWDCVINGDGSAEGCPPAVREARAIDWVPVGAVPEDLRDRLCVNCQGRYIDPLRDADQSTPPEKSQIEAHATNAVMRGDTLELSGGVEVKQGYRRLSGDSAEFNRTSRIATVNGNISLREPGILLRGEQAEIQSRTGEARLDNSRFILHPQHIRGTAEALRRDEDGVIHIDGGSLTYCAPGDQEWGIRANDLELDLKEGLATARGAKIDLGGVPVFYAPWLRMPLDDRRRTGFLWPDFGSDSNGGVDISTPIYINLAPNYDALYAPRYIQERGLNHEVELRYRDRNIGLWSFGGAFMQDDDRYRREFPDERNHDRWLAMVRHNGLFQQRWRSRVDYSKASDVNYMKDLETSSLDSRRRTSLLQLGSLDYLGDSWLVNLDVQEFQSLADDINDDYKKLPQFTARYRSKGKPFSFNPILLAQYSNFDTDTNRVTGQRLYAQAGVDYPMRWTYGFLKPTVKYRHLDYDLDRHPAYSDTQPSAGSALASLDGGLYFERQTSFDGRGLLQTLEPRLYYLYSEEEDQTGQPDFDSAELTFTYNQLFRETRFSGRDRLDDADQLSVGVTTRFINDEDGREQFSASLGQIFYFRDRDVRLNPLDPPLASSGSELAAEVTFDPNRRLNLRSSLVWDPFSGEMNAGNIQTRYTRDNGSLFNLGYSFRRPLTTVTTQPVTEQVHFSTFLPMDKNWSAFASWNYSLEANTSVEDMIGLEYDSCCWKIRLLHLRYFDTVPGQVPDFDNPELERGHSTQVQIVLKGMGGFGDRVTRILEDMIRGFEESEY